LFGFVGSVHAQDGVERRVRRWQPIALFVSGMYWSVSR